ncbi:MAG: hypothetical protein PHX21_01020 [bacterium]|nr:hypothetical protein [bacterium]
MSLQYQMSIIGSFAIVILGTYLLFLNLNFFSANKKRAFLGWVLFIVLMFIPIVKSILLIWTYPTLSIARKILFTTLEAIIYYINFGIALFIRFKILNKK